MKIISGDEFGLIKLISTQSKSVIEQYGSLDSSKSIINIFSNFEIKEAINFYNNSNEDSEIEEEEGKPNEKEKNLNLYITSLYENYILDWDSKRIISSYENENKDIYNISSTLKFPSIENKNPIFINGTSGDNLNIVSFDEEQKLNNSSIHFPFDTSNKNLKIKLRYVSNSIYNKNSIYILYQNSPFHLYNIQEKKIEFKAKNLPNDELNLRIPMHDTDIVEVKNNPRLNYISTVFGEIRLYDKKASPRPSLNKQVTKSKINKIDITDDNNYLFIGDNSGYCAMLDIRKNFSPCRTFKGNSGSIKTLLNIEQNNNLIVGGFDRYIKWYNYKTGENDKIFLKNKIKKAILVGFEKNKKVDFEDEGSEINDSEFLEEEDETPEGESENKNESSNNNKEKNFENEEELNEKEEEENEEEDINENEENEEENEEQDEIKDSEEDNERNMQKNEEEEENNEDEQIEDDEEEDEQIKDSLESKEKEDSEEKEEQNEEEDSEEKEEQNEEDDLYESKESFSKNKEEEDEDSNEESINGTEEEEENNNLAKEEEEEIDNEEEEDYEEEESDKKTKKRKREKYMEKDTKFYNKNKKKKFY